MRILLGGLLVIGGIALPLISHSASALVPAVILALAGELLGRYLFFVTVVPKHMTSPYLAMESEAA